MITPRRLLLLSPVFLAFTALLADESPKPAKDPLQALKPASPLAEQGPRPEPVPTPPPAEIDASIKRGIEFLLSHQNKNGSWGSADINRPGDIYAPVPGSHQAFRAAVTAMDISALLETDKDDPRVVKALDRAEDWLRRFPIRTYGWVVNFDDNPASADKVNPYVGLSNWDLFCFVRYAAAGPGRLPDAA